MPASTGLARQAIAPAASDSARTSSVGSEVTTRKRAREPLRRIRRSIAGPFSPGIDTSVTTRSKSAVAAWRRASSASGGLADLPAAEAEEAGDAAAGVGLVVDDQGGQHDSTRRRPRRSSRSW